MSSLSGNVLAFETLETRGCKAREDVSCPELLSQTRLECLVYTMQIVKGTPLHAAWMAALYDGKDGTLRDTSHLIRKVFMRHAV